MSEGKLLREGKIGVIPTDTIYGIAAAAHDESAVTRVYGVKQRTPAKPCIILIASISELVQFGITFSSMQKEALARYWPGPVSVSMSCGPDVPAYLHRGTHTLAFRMPDDATVMELLRESGPVIAPSANPEGMPPASTIEEAKHYFGTTVDFYVDGGTRIGPPSTVLTLGTDGSVTVIREGRGVV